MNNLVLINDGKVVVSSRMVAEKFGKRNVEVMDAIRNIATQMSTVEFSTLFIESTYTASNGKSNPEYIMNRDGFTLVSMGFTGSEAMQWKLKYISAFNEMEDKLRNSFAIPQTYAQALLLASQQAQVIEEQSLALSIAAPKAAFYDTVADSKTAIAIGDVAKIIGVKGMGRNNLFAFLRGRKILDANNVPYQKYQDRGYFNVIEQSVTMGNDVHVKFKTLVFQKGIDYISKLLKEAV